MGQSLLIRWAAFYLMEASDQDPEVTEWDDAASAQRKLNRLAARKR